MGYNHVGRDPVAHRHRGVERADSRRIGVQEAAEHGSCRMSSAVSGGGKLPSSFERSSFERSVTIRFLPAERKSIPCRASYYVDVDSRNDPVRRVRAVPRERRGVRHPVRRAADRPARGDRLDDGRRLSALVWGERAPELVFLHGGAQNAHTWDTVALALNRPLVCIDLPGHGHSDGGRGRNRELPPQRARRRGVIRAARARRARRRRHVARRHDHARARAAFPALVRAAVLVDVTPGVDHDKARAITAFVNGPESFAELRRAARAHDRAQPDAIGVVAAARDPAQRRAARRRELGLALPALPEPDRQRSSLRASPSCGTWSPRSSPADARARHARAVGRRRRRRGGAAAPLPEPRGSRT